MFEKYRPVYKKDYQQWMTKQKARLKNVAADKRRLHYHIMPAIGWLNDPNGLCQVHGTYHIYYQYDPFDTNGDLKLWGHVTTKDFIRYEEHEPFLYPDTSWDTHGVYSGCAFIEQDEIHYFYTGNIKLFDRKDHDYINSGRVSNTLHLISKDGFHFEQKQRLMTNTDYPQDISLHVRDPKVWKHEDTYYMVLGARDLAANGCVLIFSSTDMNAWSYHSRIQTKQPFGYMWECPDLFEMDGQYFLISCPQGVPTQNFDYANVHSCTAMKLKGSLTDGFQVDAIQQLDRGFDFYAPQSFVDENGRRILIGWMGIPDADYTNPTVADGWQHALTIPRQLYSKDGILHQVPLAELRQLRTHTWQLDTTALNRLSFAEAVYEMEISGKDIVDMELYLSKEICISYHDHVFTLDITGAGCGRTLRQVQLSSLHDLHIFSDTTSLELFINEGSEVFTTRVYPNHPRCVTLNTRQNVHIQLHSLRAHQIKEAYV